MQVQPHLRRRPEVPRQPQCRSVPSATNRQTPYRTLPAPGPAFTVYARPRRLRANVRSVATHSDGGIKMTEDAKKTIATTMTSTAAGGTAAAIATGGGGVGIALAGGAIGIGAVAAVAIPAVAAGAIWFRWPHAVSETEVAGRAAARLTDCALPGRLSRQSHSRPAHGSSHPLSRFTRT